MTTAIAILGPALLGAALDFLLNGVFKIGYAIIYGPAFLVAASTLLSWMARTAWKRHARLAAGALVFGAVASHLIWMGRAQTREYPVALVGQSPLVFRSVQWPGELLVVSSAPLAARLSRSRPGDQVRVAAEAVVNYGCIGSFVISSIGGVDVRNDRMANWTWRSESGAALPGPSGPGSEDQALIWCRLKPTGQSAQ